MDTFIKIAVSALIVASVAEISKRSTAFGALVAALPLTSVLAMIWLYRDTHDTARVMALSSGIAWLVLPSLLLFVLLPVLLKRGVSFYAALGIASGATIVVSLLASLLLQRLAIKS